MTTVFIIHDLLSRSECDAFREECDSWRAALSNRDLTNYGTSIDLFEDSSLSERHPARKYVDAYFTERWKYLMPSDSSHRDIMRRFLTEGLPSIVQALYEVEHGVYLFNENYIIKESGSNIAFRWHIDAEEQLAALMGSSSKYEYYSAWCALDDVSEQNGTIYFPDDTEFITYQAKIVQQSDSRHIGLCLVPTVPSLTSDMRVAASVQPSEDSEGIPVEASAGSVVIFSSTAWHRSGINTTDQCRRVLYAQYSPEIIRASGRRETSSSDVELGKRKHSDLDGTTCDKHSSESDKEGPLCFAIECTTMHVDLSSAVSEPK
jgi:Phytanoyl-CoA dioxygenase (PhyH)